MNKRRAKPRFLPWLLAVAFVAVQAITFAHEIEHDLRLHDDPSCVLHLHTKHIGNALAEVALVVIKTPREAAPSLASAIDGTTPVLGYQTRAPPLSSTRSV